MQCFLHPSQLLQFNSSDGSISWFPDVLGWTLNITRLVGFFKISITKWCCFLHFTWRRQKFLDKNEFLLSGIFREWVALENQVAVWLDKY